MRVLIFHGYLLAGTGSNVYNARLAEALARAGHEVHLVCQERHPERFAFLDAAGDWDGGALEMRELARPPRPAGEGSCTLYRPDIGALLPVYVSDRYEGLQARTFADCSEQELARYLEANVPAVREVSARARPAAALANHLVMGPVILARALGEVPYAVKVHGSALEYTVKPEPERFLPYAREGLAPARGVLVGSRHTAESLWAALADPSLAERTRLGPPGVDVERFRPQPPREAAAGLRELAEELSSSAAGVPAPAPARGAAARELSGRAREAQQEPSAFARDPREAARALTRVADGGGPIVAYVGKLIVSKGVDLLIAAWPLVAEQAPQARLLVVGFGAYREGLERLARALCEGDLEQARAIARAGRALESHDAAPVPLRHLLAFLDGLAGGERERYLRAARTLTDRLAFSGRLEHEEIARVLPACAALVVPSTFPEAFGMVAAEAAACGALPVSAAHSGLAEVTEALAREVPAPARGLLSFALGEDAVPSLAECLRGWLRAPPELRAGTREALARAVRERWSWERVGDGVLAAARGELERLARP